MKYFSDFSTFSEAGVFLNGLGIAKARVRMLKTTRLRPRSPSSVLRQALSGSLTVLPFAFVLLAGFSARAEESIQISAIGDVLIHEALYRYAVQQPEGFYSLFKAVRPQIESADFSIANLEGPTAPGVLPNGKATTDPGFVYDSHVYTGTDFVFNFHPSILDDLRKLGIDFVSTANNRALDRRQLGIDRSLEQLKIRNMPHSGTRNSADDSAKVAWELSVVKIKNFQVGFLACTEHTNGILDKSNQVLYCFRDRKMIESLVRQDKSQKLDALILLPHWGEEYKLTPNRKQVQWAEAMADAGATAIIGSHPHVLQPLDWIKTSDGRSTFVAYSLGNFVAWQAGLEKKTSGILHLTLTSDSSKDSKSKLVVTKVGWIPIFRNSYSVESARPQRGAESFRFVEKIWGTENPIILSQ